MKRVLFIVLFCCALVFFQNCRQIESLKLSNCLGKEMDLSSLTPTFNGKVLSHKVAYPKVGARMIIYLDSAQCHQCHFKSFSNYRAFQEINDEYDSFDLMYVLSPSQKERQHILHDLYLIHLHDVVYIDFDNKFLANNPFVPRGPKYHVFLLDSLSRVKLIGDPMVGSQMKELYLSTITSIVN